MLELQPPAKVNLTLEVLGRRPDGYHEIISVMQAVGLCDRLRFEVLDTPSVELVGAPPELAGDENLIVRAAHLLQAERDTGLGARIHLSKRIPIAAGLGGGSSDAAATLRALNRLWDLRLTQRALLEIGALLGSDVPFFLGSLTALVEGRGERLTPLPAPEPTWVVLLRPPVEISTREVYSRVTEAGYTDGARSRALVRQMRHSHAWRRELFNALERITCDLCPAAAAAREALREASGAVTVMTGSGPTFYTLLDDEDEARQVQSRVARAGSEAYVAPLAGPDEY